MKNIFRREFVRGGVHFFSAALIYRGLYRNRYLDGQINPKELGDAASDGMIVYSKRFLTLETPPALLTSWIIPTKHFYVRNNLLMPEAVDISQWRLRISGEVKTPVTLTYDELNQLPVTSVANTLECAGNGRVNYQPKIGGVPWGRGGVGNAVFEGCSLRRLLEKAGLKTTARHVAFRGLDTPPSGSEDFVRSIPLAKAMDDSTLVATKMNGEILTPAHGYPARTMVPGWIGAASIKWLSEIVVLPEEYKGFFMNPGYRIPSVQTGNNSDGTISLTSLRLKSIITEPAENKLLSLSSNAIVKIGGAAWGGESRVAGVSVSTDGGHTWKEAKLGLDQAKYSWRLWSYEWSPARAGEYLIQSRAFDTKGNVQPLKPVWNAGGYMWNGIDQVRVRIQ
jgi:DMSO/TMAO reductase YedYZ molybdopterin-dependent catalytic subunit